jgi:hypothetical protein
LGLVLGGHTESLAGADTGFFDPVENISAFTLAFPVLRCIIF